MAFRIHDSVVRGEIDNRVKGVVRGRLWVHGRAEPVVLDLKGNAWPDLAGCLLTFKNPHQRTPHQHLDSLAPLQRGVVGDLTASRKVRVFDVPPEQVLDLYRRQEKPAEQMANSLFLEWFSEANGRVVIESTKYELTLSAPEWRLSPAEDDERARQAAAGMADFLRQLGELSEPHQRVEDITAACEEALSKPPPEPDPQREGMDWVRTEDGDVAHPLQHRCFQNAMKYWKLIHARRFAADKDLTQFMSEFQMAAARLAGALDGLAQGGGLSDPTSTIDFLKRALDHLEEAQAGLFAASDRHLLTPEILTGARKDLFEIREGILKLIEEFRRHD